MIDSVRPWPVAAEGSTNHPIETLQYLLRAQGLAIRVDGVFGPATTVAVRSFQYGHGLVPDGVVGPLTWRALIVRLARGSHGEAVRGVQGEFQFRNLSGDPARGVQIDGEFGSLTRDAVIDLQQALALDVDGVVGPVTWQALISGMLSF